MSLFQAREWWSYVPDQDPEMNPELPQAFSMTLGAFPGVTGGQSDVLLTASLSGMIRIFSPFIDEDQQNDGNRNWSPTNLLLELQLPDPILQIETGKLTSS